MAKVFVVNKAPYDFTDAEAYGEVIFCTQGLVDKYDTGLMYREIAEAMQDSQEGDYILLTSLHALCGVACAIFAAKHQCLNLLLHRGNTYITRHLYLKGL